MADLAEPLPYPDAAFDDVIASLVLHYLEDWTAPLAELHRVLRPGGRLPDNRHRRTALRAGHPRELLPEAVADGRSRGALCFMFFVLEAC